MKNILVNAIGQACPVPVVMTVKAIEGLSEPAVVETRVDNEVAVQNLLHMAKKPRVKRSKRKNRGD